MTGYLKIKNIILGMYKYFTMVSLIPFLLTPSEIRKKITLTSLGLYMHPSIQSIKLHCAPAGFPGARSRVVDEKRKTALPQKGL